MKINKQIRLENARTLQREAGGQKGMIEITGRGQSQLSQIMGDTASKPIGDTIARSLEIDFDKPKGWMDKDHSALHVDDVHQKQTIETVELRDGGQRGKYKKLLTELSENGRLEFIEDISEMVSTEGAARAAAIFSARVQRDLAKLDK